MPYKIENITALKPFVRLIYNGNVSIEELYKSRLEVAELLKQNNCKMLLVNVSEMQDNFSIIDNYDFTSTHSNILQAGLKIALVYRIDAVEKAIFAEDISNNRGILMRAFTNEREAVSWLIEKN